MYDDLGIKAEELHWAHNALRDKKSWGQGMRSEGSSFRGLGFTCNTLVRRNIINQLVVGNWNFGF